MRSRGNSEQPKCLWPHPAAPLKGIHDYGAPLICPSCALPTPGRGWERQATTQNGLSSTHGCSRESPGLG